MEKTEQFGLNQWAMEDRIMMKDFNDDNAAIEAALAKHEAAIPKIAMGTYTGKGVYGSSNKNTLTFDFKPSLVIILANDTETTGAGTILLQGQTQSAGTSAQYNASSLELTVAWSGNSVTWYSAQNADRQMNGNGGTYHYFVLGF